MIVTGDAAGLNRHGKDVRFLGPRAHSGIGQSAEARDKNTS